jgi:hypothetical protein
MSQIVLCDHGKSFNWLRPPSVISLSVDDGGHLIDLAPFNFLNEDSVVDLLIGHIPVELGFLDLPVELHFLLAIESKLIEQTFLRAKELV